MKWLAFFLVLFPSVAWAITPCLNNPRIPRDYFVARLASEEQEHLTWQGLTSPPNDNYLLELFVSEEGPWTLILTGVDSLSCAVADGAHWIPFAKGQ
jgi:hypothetical protein